MPRRSTRTEPSPSLLVVVPSGEPAMEGILCTRSPMSVTPLCWMASAEMIDTGLALSMSGRAMREPVTTISSRDSCAEAVAPYIPALTADAVTSATRTARAMC